MKPCYLPINGTWILGKCLGKGSFGQVFKGYHKETWQPVAIKLEPVEVKNKILEHEYHVYRALYRPGYSLCQCHYYGVQNDFNVLVIDMLGPSLSDLLTRCGGTFSLKTVMMIGDQLLNRLEYIHERYFLHRDLKPENFLVGLGGEANRIHIIDYGLTKQYRVGNKHIGYKTGYKLVGTARYASVHSHQGVRLSRRDDLESLVYILVYFLKGRLPWQSLAGKDRAEKYEQIRILKEQISAADLCIGLPEELVLMLEHAKGLEYTERPDYKYCRGLLEAVMKREGLVYDLQFDWLARPVVEASALAKTGEK